MIYIAGKISGMKPKEFIHKFDKAELKLVHAGFTKVLNPVKKAIKLEKKLKGNLDDFPSLDYDQYLANSLIHLFKCNSIYMLKDYKASKGALLELEIAKLRGMQIYYEDENEL